MEKNKFVDREQQMELLQRSLRSASSGKGNAVLVEGPAGIGKTTLLKAFATSAKNSKRAEPFLARCSPISTQGSAYQPFITILTRWHSESRNWKDLASGFLSDVAPEWLNLIPIAGTALTASAKTVGWIAKESNTSEQEMRTKRQEQFIKFLKKSSDTLGTLLIIIDDIHWIDPESALLWLHVAQQIKNMPIMLLGSYRSDLAFDKNVTETAAFEQMRESALQRRLLTEISLNEMSVIEVTKYMMNELNVASIPDTLVKLLMKETGGNPFFIKQLIGYAIESGTFEIRDKKLFVEGMLADRLPTSFVFKALPVTVQSVITERLRRLAEDLRNLLHYASVQGEEFYTTVLAVCLSSNELSILRDLRELKTVHRLVDSKQDSLVKSDTGDYIFLHRIVWQTVYDQLAPREKQLLHRMVAETTEQQHPELVQSGIEMTLTMARHWEYAGNYVKAASYILQACQHAQATHLYSEAIRYREQGLKLLSNVSNLDSTGKHIKFDIASQLIIKLIQQSKVDAQALNELQGLAQELGFDKDLGNVLMWKYWLNNLNGDVQQAYENAKAAGQIRHKLGNLLGEAEAIVGMCKMMARRGELAKVAPLYEKAISRYKEGLKKGQDDAEDWIFFYLNRSYALAMMDFGDYERAIRYFKTSITKAEANNDWFQIVESSAHLAEAYLFIGQYELAHETAQRGIDLSADDSVARWQRLECEVHLGTLSMINKKYDKAREIFLKAQEDALERDSSGWWEIVGIKYSLASLELLTNSVDGGTEAIKIGSYLIDLAQKRGFLHARVQGLMCQAMGLLVCKDYSKALTASETAMAILSETIYVVATPTEDISYLHAVALKAVGRGEEAEKYSVISDMETNRKSILIKNDLWRATYFQAAADRRILMDLLLH